MFDHPFDNLNTDLIDHAIQTNDLQLLTELIQMPNLNRNYIIHILDQAVRMCRPDIVRIIVPDIFPLRQRWVEQAQCDPLIEYFQSIQEPPFPNNHHHSENRANQSRRRTRQRSQHRGPQIRSP